MSTLVSHGRLSVVDMCPAYTEGASWPARRESSRAGTAWGAGLQALLWRLMLWMTFVVVLLAAFGVAATLGHMLGQVWAVVRELWAEGA